MAHTYTLEEYHEYVAPQDFRQQFPQGFPTRGESLGVLIDKWGNTGLGIDLIRAYDEYTHPGGFIDEFRRRAILGLIKSATVATPGGGRLPSRPNELGGITDDKLADTLNSTLDIIVPPVQEIEQRDPAEEAETDLFNPATQIKNALETEQLSEDGDINLLKLDIEARNRYFPNGVSREFIVDLTNQMQRVMSEVSQSEGNIDRKLSEMYLMCASLSTAIGFSSAEAITAKDIRNIGKFNPEVIRVLGNYYAENEKLDISAGIHTTLGQAGAMRTAEGVKLGNDHQEHDKYMEIWTKAWKDTKDIWKILNSPDVWTTEDDEALYTAIIEGSFSGTEMRDLINKLIEIGRIVETDDPDAVGIEDKRVLRATPELIQALISTPDTIREHARKKQGQTVLDFSSNHGEWLDRNLCFFKKGDSVISMDQNPEFMLTLLGFEMTELSEKLNLLLEITHASSEEMEMARLAVMYEISDLFNFIRSYFWYKNRDTGEKLVENIVDILQ